MTLQDIIVDIHALHEDLEVYERKYGVLSERRVSHQHSQIRHVILDEKVVTDGEHLFVLEKVARGGIVLCLAAYLCNGHLGCLQGGEVFRSHGRKTVRLQHGIDLLDRDLGGSCDFQANWRTVCSKVH